MPSRRGLRGLYGNRKNIVSLLFLFGVYGLWGIVAGQAGIFMPRIYDSAGLHSVIAQDLLQVLLWGCTVAATFFGFMAWADRISQRLLYAGGAALGVVGWLVLVFLGSAGLPALLAFAVLWGVSCGIGAQAFYGLWASEMFATPYRASAQGTLFFAARVAIGVLSFFFPALLSATGLPVVGLLLIGLLVVALVIGFLGAPLIRRASRCRRSRTSATDAQPISPRHLPRHLRLGTPTAFLAMESAARRRKWLRAILRMTASEEPPTLRAARPGDEKHPNPRPATR